MLTGRCLGRAARVISVCALLVSPVLADETAPPPVARSEHADLEEPAIPPGQEELLSAMLGKGTPLPGGCTLSAGNVEHTLVKATYTCPGGEVVVELAHPSTAAQPAVSTERFAITVLSGVPPTELTDALAGLIRTREGAFVWMVPTAKSTRSPAMTILAAALVLLATAVLIWLWQRRRARRASRAARAA
jgi:hypothetical protein